MTRYPSYRYKCDHCGKTGGRGGAMASHEKGCTMNPLRVCWHCKQMGEEQVPIDTLKAAVVMPDSNGEGASMEAVGKLTSCPVCKLAALRQRCDGVTVTTTVLDIFLTGSATYTRPAIGLFDWSFKDEMRDWRASERPNGYEHY